MTHVFIKLHVSELVYMRSAVAEGITRYKEALEETKVKHPGCEEVYQIALGELSTGLRVLNKACNEVGLRPLDKDPES